MHILFKKLFKSKETKQPENDTIHNILSKNQMLYPLSLTLFK